MTVSVIGMPKKHKHVTYEKLESLEEMKNQDELRPIFYNNEHTELMELGEDFEDELAWIQQSYRIINSCPECMRRLRAFNKNKGTSEEDATT